MGEKPEFADFSGINVFKVRYMCTVFGGAMSGLAGAYLSLSYISAWVEGVTAGQGWIALALVILSGWNPLYAICVYLFGAITTLQFHFQTTGLPPPLLMTFPYLFAIFALVFWSHPKLRDKFKSPSSLGKPYMREKL